MDFSSFGALGGMPGGLSGNLYSAIQKRFASPMSAPTIPADGSMQPTIGPGAVPPAAAPQSPVKMGLPPGGILGLLQGQSPQGLMGLLQRAMPNATGAPLAGAMPQAGMLPGMSAAPPVAPPAAQPQLPMNIDPMNQF